jgi:hypothetical protein
MDRNESNREGGGEKKTGKRFAAAITGDGTQQAVA